MPKDYPRSLRIGEQIHREIAVMLRDDINDPRVHDLAITEVIVNKDLSVARVYYAQCNDTESRDELQAGLDSCAAHLRKQLGRVLHVRSIPKLVFLFDETNQRSTRLEEILIKEKYNNISD